MTSLDAAPLGVDLRITGARCSAELVRRLSELGIRPDAVVTVLRRTAGRGRILDVDGARLALGRDLTRLIDAEVVQS